ncbi:hypothetical protein BGZ72_007205 [Mortierella alpina]|nr:hypothetical protein BGZ72_007205 [Mortierella alpina]
MLIYDLQQEFNCQGYDNHSTGSLEAYPGSGDLPSCGEILKMNFGKRLEKLGSMLLVIRLLQLSGALLLSILFKYLAVVDQEESGDENVLVRTAEKLEYGLTEKQLEDMHARVPLLLADGIDECGPPPYICEGVSVE